MIKVSGNVVRVLPLAALVFGLSCCGGGSADGSNAASAMASAQKLPVNPASPEAGRSRGLPSGGCGAAAIKLGRSPGAIDFTMRCRPRPGGQKVRFAVGLSPMSSGVGVRVRSFRRHPQVREPGLPPRYGTCRLYGGGLACYAPVHGRIVINGRLWVEQGDECDARVVITESRPTRPCPSFCTGSEMGARVVVKARPRGC